MLTLAVTSSTAVVGVALRTADALLCSEHLSTDRRHAEELTPMIQRVLLAAECTLGDVGRLAVDVGPGRFTGLRVGITTVRTLAFALQIPVVAVTSLEVLALSQGPIREGSAVTAVIDARRAEVFQQRFGPEGPLDEASYGPPEEMAGRVGPTDVVLGDGADRYAETYGAVPGASHLVGVEPLAAIVAQISLDRSAVAGSLVAPIYLRDPDVQVNIKTRHNT